MIRPIRVLFDANPLVRRKTGVGYYTEGLVTALAKMPQLELRGFYFAPRGGPADLPSGIAYTSLPWALGQAVKGLRKLRLRLPIELLARRRADILLFPDFTSWPSLLMKPKILTIHDLTYIDYPQYVRKRNLKHLRRFVKKDARKAKLILTISDFTKRRITEALGIAPSKILVEPVPPAKPIKAKKPADLPAKFILFISTIEPRKNLDKLAEAYNLLPEKLSKQYALVVAGGSGWHSDKTLEYIRSLQGAGHNIVIMGYVDEPTRAALYRQAVVVAVPSIYEGFGMPLLEAMSYGTPVAASGLPVFREVAGQAAVYFDPGDAKSIKSTLQKLLTDPSLRQKQAKAGAERLKLYSWDQVAADIYKRIAQLAGRAE